MCVCVLLFLYAYLKRIVSYIFQCMMYCRIGYASYPILVSCPCFIGRNPTY